MYSVQLKQYMHVYTYMAVYMHLYICVHMYTYTHIKKSLEQLTREIKT